MLENPPEKTVHGRPDDFFSEMRGKYEKKHSAEHHDATEAHHVTRFGMIPDHIGEDNTTGFHVATQITGHAIDIHPTFEMDAKPLLSHVSQKRSKVASFFAFLLSSWLPLTLCILATTAAGALFFYSDEISAWLSGQPAANSSGSDSDGGSPHVVPGESGRSSEIKVFDTTANGKSFVFLVDCSSTMEFAAPGTPYSFVKPQLLNALKSLNHENKYAVLFYNDNVFVSQAESGGGTASLNLADSVNIIRTQKIIEDTTPNGSSDPKKGILAALRLEPDTIFWICESSNWILTGSDDVEQIKRGIKKTNINILELGKGRKPYRGTLLEIFSKNINISGKYSWVNLESLPSRSATNGFTEQPLFENVPVPMIATALETDFDPKFIQDISTPQSRSYNPFLEPRPSFQPQPDTSLLTRPKIIPLPNSVINDIEMDARIVYLSAFTSSPQSPSLLLIGAENRLSLWVRGAKAELPVAEYLIGLCYLNGRRVNRDEAKALDCFLKAAKQGCVPAMTLYAEGYYTRGDHLFSRRGTNTPEQETARYWMEKAANLGDPVAQTWMGSRIVGTPAERIDWLKKAVAVEYPEAEYLYGQSFELGTGVPEDRNQAIMWYEKAAAHKHSAAAAALERLSNRLP